MEFQPKHILIGLTLALFASVTTATAQESSFSTNDSIEPDREKAQFTPSTESEKTQIKRDTASIIKSVTPRPKQAEAQKVSEKQQQQQGSSDSVLSFNFLYYFIQKFKMSDISDQ